MRTWTMTMASDNPGPSKTHRLTDAELRATLWNLLHGSGTFDIEAGRAGADAPLLAA
jgi:hypothetical protein